MPKSLLKKLLSAHPNIFDGVDHGVIARYSEYVGAIVMTWAGIESSMDQANYYAWAYSGKRISEKVPVSLGRKIEQFKKINRDLLPLQPLRETATELCVRIDRLFDDRHWIVHGYLAPKECRKGVWTVSKNEFPKSTGGLITRKRTFTKAELDRLKIEIIQLACDFADYLTALSAEISKHHPDDIIG